MRSWHIFRRSFLPTKESESIGERNEILFAWPPGSFVSSGGITRIRTAGRTAGFAARTFTCLDHRNGTIAFAKQPVVTRDQIKDTIHPSFSLCSFLLTSFRCWGHFLSTSYLDRWHGTAKTCLETNTLRTRIVVYTMPFVLAFSL